MHKKYCSTNSIHRVPASNANSVFSTKFRGKLLLCNENEHFFQLLPASEVASEVTTKILSITKPVH